MRCNQVHVILYIYDCNMNPDSMIHMQIPEFSDPAIQW